MTTKIHFLAMLLIVLSTASRATDKKDAEKGTTMEVVRQGNVFKLFYLKKDIEKVKVKIIDKRGRVFFTEVIKNDQGFMRPYNFKDLSHGEYQIIVSESGNDLVKTIFYVPKDITTQGVFRLVKMDPIKDKERVYQLTIVNQGDAKATINVRNEDQGLIFSKTESFTGNYGELYNLNQIRGRITVEVAVGAETEVFEF